MMSGEGVYNKIYSEGEEIPIISTCQFGDMGYVVCIVCIVIRASDAGQRYLLRKHACLLGS